MERRQGEEEKKRIGAGSNPTPGKLEEGGEGTP
jgi:hypothetical protein